MELRKNFWPCFWTIIAILMMIGMFIFGYHSPIKTSDASQSRIYIELSRDTCYDSIMFSTISVDPSIRSLDGEEVQSFSFNSMKKDSTVNTHNGYLYLGRKILGFDIDSIEVVN